MKELKLTLKELKSVGINFSRKELKRVCLIGFKGTLADLDQYIKYWYDNDFQKSPLFSKNQKRKIKEAGDTKLECTSKIEEQGIGSNKKFKLRLFVKLQNKNFSGVHEFSGGIFDSKEDLVLHGMSKTGLKKIA